MEKKNNYEFKLSLISIFNTKKITKKYSLRKICKTKNIKKFS